MLHERWGLAPPEPLCNAEASNHPLLLCTRDMVVSELGKGGVRPCQVGIAESNELWPEVGDGVKG